VQLDEEAKNLLIQYSWPGNVRELKNIAEQISVLSEDKLISGQQLRRFIPENLVNRLPMVIPSAHTQAPNDFSNEREILYKLFFDMKKDVTELKKMFLEILKNPSLAADVQETFSREMKELKPQEHYSGNPVSSAFQGQPVMIHNNGNSEIQHHEEVEESLSIMDKEKELIVKALKKHKGKRKDASSDLGISERTLYRKLKEYDISE
jgi:DNA-binding NtrC family response regulator